MMRAVRAINIALLLGVGFLSVPALKAKDGKDHNISSKLIEARLRKVMESPEKKNLLMIEPCLSSHLLILKAKEKGYNSIVLSANSDQRSLNENALGASTSFFQIETNNDEQVLQLVDQISKNVRIDAVTPGSEYYVPLTAKVSERLGRLGLSPEAALRARRKDLMRDALAQYNVLIPAYKKVKNLTELQEAVGEIGFPCVIKPVDFAGSVNVKKVTNIQEAENAFQAIVNHQGVDDSWGGRPIQKSALVEEYIKGKEYSVEGFSKNKEVHIASVTEKIKSSEVDFVEIGHIVRSKIDEHLHQELQQYIEKVVSALDLRYGPFHAEVRMSDRGPVLMEIAMRLAGDYIPKLIEYATGVDYYENTIRLLLGEKLLLDKTRDLNAAITFFYNPNVKTISSNDYLLSLTQKPNVREVKPYYKVGEAVPEFPMEKHKLGYAIVVHEDVNELKNIVNELEKKAIF